jgi:small subunit ribosomal protein S1
MVDIGMEAFLPASLVDVRPVRNLDQFVNFVGKFLIVKINHKRRNIVLSRKDYLERERKQARRGRIESLQAGQVIKGRVKNITDFGAFIDLGQADGLLHITDMSWGRISHPSKVVKLGEEIEVVILGVDKDQEKVSLGMKQRLGDPWEKASQKYPIGSRVRGKVVNILPYGAFVELEPGVEGLVHVSEMSWSKKVKNPSKVVSPGETVEAVVSDVNREARRISLSLKDTLPTPGGASSRNTRSGAASPARCAT